MARPCRLCEHPDREELETALLRRERTQEDVAGILGTTKQAISLHVRNHVPEAVRLAISQGKATQAGLNVTRQLIEINQASREILEGARKAEDPGLALRAIDRVEKQLRLQAEILGDIQAGVTVNVNQAPAFLEFRALVLNVLDEYPEVKTRLLEKLKRANADRGHDNRPGPRGVCAGEAGVSAGPVAGRGPEIPGEKDDPPVLPAEREINDHGRPGPPCRPLPAGEADPVILSQPEAEPGAIP